MHDTRQPRIGLSMMLFVTGLIYASWAARIPAVRDNVGLATGYLALALVAEHAGSVAGLQIGAMVVPRVGSRATLRLFLPAFAAALILPAFAWDLPSLVVGLVVFGVLNSVVDIAINSHGAVVETRCGRPIFSRLHAMHSIGAIAGANGGALLAAAGLDVRLHFALAALGCAAVATVAGRMLFASEVDRRSTAAQHHRSAERHQQPQAKTAPRSPIWTRDLAVLGGLAFCCTLAEGSVADWSSVLLRGFGASEAFAALGFAAFAAMMVAGRLVGDPLRRRLGAVRALRSGVLLAGAGLLLGLVGHTPVTGLIGFMVLGAGLSFTLPTVLAAASRLPVDSAATSVARVSTVGYLGFSAGPALIGLVAQSAGLTVAMLIPVALLVATAWPAGAVGTADAVVATERAVPVSASPHA